MKILHVVPSYIPAYRHGGPVKAVHELCKALVDKGHDITVFTTNADGRKTLDIPFYGDRPRIVEGVKVFYFPLTFIRWYFYAKYLWRTFKKRIPDFDLIHIHAVFLYPTLAAAALARRYKIPYLLNPFGALDPLAIRERSFIKKSLYLRLVEQRNIRKASAMHLVSEYEKKQFLSLGFKTPVHVVSRGLNIADYPNLNHSRYLRERYPQLRGKKAILFLGRVYFEKGLDLLGEAFERVLKRSKDVFLIIAGPDERGCLKKLKAAFRKTGIIKNVLFTGMLLGDDKLSALYGSDIFVLPSHRESFGIAVLEAMACRLPVIVTNRVGLVPHVKEYQAGIVTDCDSDEIAEAILKLLEDQALRQSLGQNGRRLIEDRFTMDKIADQMAEVYSSVVNGYSLKIG